MKSIELLLDRWFKVYFKRQFYFIRNKPFVLLELYFEEHRSITMYDVWATDLCVMEVDKCKMNMDAWVIVNR